MPITTLGSLMLGLRNFLVTTVFIAFMILASLSSASQSDFDATNSISGSVRIFDRDGKEKKDHSSVVIFIDKAPRIAGHRSVPNSPQISHKGRRFSPGVLPIARGTTVDFYNDDNIYHNVFSLSVAKRFDLGIYPVGTSKLVKFTKTGLVNIYCNIHPNMASTILVLNNEFFAKTDSDGTYEIRGIPDGHLRVRLWSRFSEEQSRVVRFGDGVQQVELFKISETKQIVQHKNKFGKRYRENY